MDQSKETLVGEVVDRIDVAVRRLERAKRSLAGGALVGVDDRDEAYMWLVRVSDGMDSLIDQLGNLPGVDPFDPDARA